MKYFLLFALAAVSLSDVILARATIPKFQEVIELRELLHDALQKRRIEAAKIGATAEMEEMMEARGAWDDFKASLKKAGQKVKNAFGKKDEEEGVEEKRQVDFGNSAVGVSDAELKMYKQEILNWKEMVRSFGIQNDPEIKKMEAQLDQVWDMLGLDNV